MNIKDNKTSPIGFFDSGVGGLSVLARFRKVLPFENILYYGDTIHLPYGNKSKDELVSYARNILKFMMSRNVKAVVIACNTSSAQAYDTVKDMFNFPIYPIIQSCAKGVIDSRTSKVGVFATEATVKSGEYTIELKKCNPNVLVKEIASTNWVSIVEKTTKNIEEDIKNIKSEVEEMMKFHPDKIILGCTHYPYLLDELTKYASKELFIDPAKIFVDFIKSDLEKRKLLNLSKTNGKEEFFVSSNPDEFIQNGKIFYEIKNPPILHLC